MEMGPGRFVKGLYCLCIGFHLQGSLVFLIAERARMDAAAP